MWSTSGSEGATVDLERRLLLDEEGEGSTSVGSSLGFLRLLPVAPVFRLPPCATGVDNSLRGVAVLRAFLLELPCTASGSESESESSSWDFLAFLAAVFDAGLGAADWRARLARFGVAVFGPIGVGRP